MPIRYSSTTRTQKTKKRINSLTELQSGDDFYDEICTDDALCQNDRAECVESVAGRAPWSAQALYLV